MSLIKTALTLALAGYAANTIMKARRNRPAENGTNGELASATAPLVGIDSPNEAERLQARGVSSPASGNDGAADFFTSTSQDSPYARSPGLPDLMRGA
jgi:hypothetical protein